MTLKSCNKIETNTYEVEVTVSPEEFNDACRKAYNKTKKRYELPGFRKGKAPQHMIEKMYGESVFYEDALDIIYPDIVTSAISDADLNVVDAPYDVDFPVISHSEGVELKMKLTTYPEVTLGEYKGLKVTKLPCEVTDEDVEIELKSQQERNSRLVDVTDRAAKEGDTTAIDFEGFIDDVPFEGGKGENYPLELGSGSFIPGFEEQIVGHCIDEEFDVNVTFPDDYDEKYAGRDAVFKCKINSIKEKELPALDDEFAKDISEFDTLDEVKEDIRKKIAAKKEKDSKTDMENQLVEQVATSMEAEIPQCMIDQKVDELYKESESRMQSQGISMDMYLAYINKDENSYKEELKKSAEQQVRQSVAITAIIEKENIEASEDDINAKVAELAEDYAMPEDQIRKILTDTQLSNEIKVDKALQLLVDAAKVE